MMELRVNDLFCGAGGMGLGFKQAGFRLSGAWDFDKWAVESYGNNVSPKVKQADITMMKGEEVPYADVWTFGFPCQDLSVAGKQAGMIKGETRSGLFFEVMRLLEEVTDKPKVIMAENVKGLKKYLPVLEEEYNRVGYRMYVMDQNKGIFNSKYWGVPQNRERYFVVGVRDDIEKEFIFPHQQTHYIPKLSGVLEENVDEKYYIDDERASRIIEQVKSKAEMDEKVNLYDPYNKRFPYDQDATNTLRTNYRTGSSWVIEKKKVVTLNEVKEGLKVKQATKKGYDIAIPGDSINIAHPNSKTRRGRVGKQVAQTLMTSCEQVVVEKIPFPTMEDSSVLESYRIRKLTPREYARLQGFPDDYKFVVSNSQLYKQFGNAVTVNVAKALAESIKEFLEG